MPFLSKPLTTLTWKYIAVPSLLLGQNPGNSLPNSTVGVPTSLGPQQFKAAAHHHLREGN